MSRIIKSLVSVCHWVCVLRRPPFLFDFDEILHNCLESRNQDWVCFGWKSNAPIVYPSMHFQIEGSTPQNGHHCVFNKNAWLMFDMHYFSNYARYTQSGGINGSLIVNYLLWVQWSRDWWYHVTAKGQIVSPKYVCYNWPPTPIGNHKLTMSRDPNLMALYMSDAYMSDLVEL